MPHDPIPRVQSGLPRAIERQLMCRYARTTAGRMTLAAALRALAVLVGRHPRAALDAAGSGLVQAGRVGVQDLTRRLGRYERRTSPPAEAGRRAPLTPANADASAGFSMRRRSAAGRPGRARLDRGARAKRWTDRRVAASVSRSCR